MYTEQSSRCGAAVDILGSSELSFGPVSGLGHRNFRQGLAHSCNSNARVIVELNHTPKNFSQ